MAEALRRVEEGASILCLDVPIGTRFGIDLFSAQVGEKFKGIKMIPEGAHVVVWSAVSNSGDVGIKSSVLLHLSKGEVLIWRWNNQEEVFTDISQTPQGEDLIRGVKGLHFDQNLGAYQLETYQNWRGITSMIAHAHVHAHFLKQNNATEHRFTPISRRELLREHAELKGHDTTPLILHITTTCYKNDHSALLAELQASFALFLVGESYPALEHWKVITSLLCEAQTLVTSHAEFERDFLDCLISQLKALPPDFFCDPLSGDSFLRSSLQSLNEILSQTQLSPTLNTRKSKLVQLLSSRFSLALTRPLEDQLAQLVGNQTGDIDSETLAELLAQSGLDEDELPVIVL